MEIALALGGGRVEVERLEVKSVARTELTHWSLV